MCVIMDDVSFFGCRYQQYTSTSASLRVMRKISTGQMMVKRATLLGETLAHLEECQLESVCVAYSPSWRIHTLTVTVGSTEARVLR